MNETSMTSFILELQDTSHSETFAEVSSFVGEDESGSFGILPNHGRMMTMLVMGLARFRVSNEDWQYIATPGALIYFNNNKLTLSTRHFFIDNDYLRINTTLQEQLLEEETQLHRQNQSLRRMEEEVLRRLWDISRTAP